MKKILNKMGFISKQAIFGAALGVATVAVGVGIATNFVGKSSSLPKGVSTASLGQYSTTPSNYNDGAYSKAALEEQMAQAELARSNNSVTSLRKAAAGEDFAYSNSDAALADNDNQGSYNGASNSYDIEGSQAGAIDGMAAGGGISAVEAGAVPNSAGSYSGAIAQAQAADETEAKLQASRNKGEAQNSLRTSSMSSGSSRNSGANSSVSYNASTAQTGARKAVDSSSKAISQNHASGLSGGSNMQGAKTGRINGMGGANNVNGGSGRASGHGSYSNVTSE
ncbi:MAG: hypothetical protein LBM71_05175, partial [Elusimicrobiota bacterium]|nr:hypothetical protein [Elusimicrobiota bacterium]